MAYGIYRFDALVGGFSGIERLTYDERFGTDQEDECALSAEACSVPSVELGMLDAPSTPAVHDLQRGEGERAALFVGNSVWLRLVRGKCNGTPALHVSPRDGIVAVGASSECRWQLQGEGMPPVALYVRLLAGTLFVRASSRAQVELDGQRVGAIWSPVAQGTRVSVAGAVIEVGLAGRSRHAQGVALGRKDART